MRLAFVCILSLAALLGGLVPAQAEPWTVVLTDKQAKGLSEIGQRNGNWAMAISPDGAWGWAHSYQTKDMTAQRALQFCQQWLRPGRRDCVLYAVNGARVAPKVVETRKVSKVYKPVDGKGAAAYFGLANVNFAGNRAAALEELKQVQADANRQATLPKDPALRKRLMGLSLMAKGRKGFAIYFTDGQVGRFAQGNRLLRQSYASWFVTPNGLLCLQRGVWLDNGQDAGTQCLILSDIAAGQGKMSWDNSPNTKRNIQLVAGDARFGAAK